MSPQALTKARLTEPKKPPNIMEQRFGRYAKGAILPETIKQSCPRRKVSEFPKDWLPRRYFEKNLEHNQLVRTCCRHTENHEIEGFKSHPDEKLTDIYIIHCQCGRKHRVFCVGYTDNERPEWK